MNSKPKKEKSSNSFLILGAFSISLPLEGGVKWLSKNILQTHLKWKNSPSQLKDAYLQNKNYYASSPITEVEFFQTTLYITEPPPTQPRTQASPRYLSYPTSLTGDVTSEIAEGRLGTRLPPTTSLCQVIVLSSSSNLYVTISNGKFLPFRY